MEGVGVGGSTLQGVCLIEVRKCPRRHGGHCCRIIENVKDVNGSDREIINREMTEFEYVVCLTL